MKTLSGNSQVNDFQSVKTALASRSYKLLLLLVLLSCYSFSFSPENMFNETFFSKISDKYGEDRTHAFHEWQKLIINNTQRDAYEQLNRVNQFANRNIQFKTDIEHWGKDDYWATPIESLGTGFGDCEDYAIFKYVSLIASGIEESKLRLMYVRALTIDEPHMVLIYSEEPNSIPLVLDNLKSRILPANKRPDLKPIYSFNGQGLWLSKAQGLGNKVKSGSGSKDWTQLMERIEQGQ
ncbi:transglutaminase-like cysteine peptidase [Shewanella sp. TC10]|uniref:transglutaminase-like cysteine peptidase n=1 Tax=Shewanella sp. TC10 TaxID=1419739 RepID=UPI001E5313D3|nr:transglutaminase-like cysteine peptidase [Shewanella sp. TC10]